MSTETIADLIRTRRTIHEFKPAVPPRKQILQAIELARWAPNHRLTQPWRFYLLGPETVTAIVDLNTRLVQAKAGEQAAEAKRARWLNMPGWLVVTCVKSNDPIQAQEDYAACCCAVQNLLLYLWSAGIGVKWNTGAVVRAPEFYELLWVDPAIETVVGLFWYGYPAEIPEMRRRPAEELVIELP